MLEHLGETKHINHSLSNNPAASMRYVPLVAPRRKQQRCWMRSVHWVAFFTDIKHEILPVLVGERVTIQVQFIRAVMTTCNARCLLFGSTTCSRAMRSLGRLLRCRSLLQP